MPFRHTTELVPSLHATLVWLLERKNTRSFRDGKLNFLEKMQRI